MIFLSRVYAKTIKSAEDLNDVEPRSGLLPQKWSSLIYGLESDGGHEHKQEEAHGQGDRRQTAAS
jgi:hypothetical protein